MEDIPGLIEITRFLNRVWTWFISPSVRPLLGVVAAVAAAMLVVPGDWIRRPEKAVLRSLLIGIAWVLMVFLAGSFWPSQGNGAGGSSNTSAGSTAAGGSEPTASSSAGGTQPQPGSEPLPPLAVGGPSPEGATIHIRFFPSADRPQQAVNLACQVDDVPSARQWTIHSKTRDDFRRELRQRLGELANAAGSQPQLVVIDRVPFPGEGTIREIKTQARHLFRESKIEFVTGPTATTSLESDDDRQP